MAEDPETNDIGNGVKGDRGVRAASSANDGGCHRQTKGRHPSSSTDKGTDNSATSDIEDGFLSTSPDSANGEIMSKPGDATKTAAASATPMPPPICLCTDPKNCVTLKDILDSFKSALSEEQAWALIYQFVSLYRKIAASTTRHVFGDLEMPDAIQNMSVHRDGTVHCSWSDVERRKKQQKMHEQKRAQLDALPRGDDNYAMVVASHKKVLRKVAVTVFTALDYGLQEDEQCHMTQDLEDLFNSMSADESDDDCLDEGCIDEGWGDESDDDKTNDTKEFDRVLETCRNHVKPTVPEDHYKAVCHALVTETIELRTFLQQVLNDGADNLHMKADSQTSKQELAKLGFNDWARFWVQVIDELRRGVRLKKNTYSRAPIEYELTPYEILMEDIRSKKYQLRKVMVNGDIPPRVKKDAHALILEFIRSRPPLKKASERKLPPPIMREPSPRERLMDSIRKGQKLKHIPPPTPLRLKDRLLPSSTTTAIISATATISTSPSSSKAAVCRRTLDAFELLENVGPHSTSRSKQRLIKVDFSLLQDDDNLFDESNLASTSSHSAHRGVCSQPKMPPYPIGGYIASDVNTNNTTHTQSSAKAKAAPSAQLPPTLTTRVLRRTNYDLATQCESRRASVRRHTIVGCQSNDLEEPHSMPPTRPESRQSDVKSIAETDDDVSTTKQLHNNFNQQQQEQQQLQLKRSQSPNVGVGVDGSTTNNNNNNNCGHSPSSVGPWNKSFLDEKTWLERGDDRLSLTLEEIVHIRSVMTKAELEGLPVGVRVKEDVEKRKVCFLCLRTRFSLFGPWGIQCKLCKRTVCSKCHTKMRIPSEHFRNVPLVLISPSLLASPASSNTPSPSHHSHYGYSSSTGNIVDETFPKSLIERLLRSESDKKARNSVGSAPSSPKHQRSNMSTPGSGAAAAAAAGQAVEALHDASMTSSYTAGTTSMSGYGGKRGMTNGGAATLTTVAAQAHNKHISLMSRSMEGPRSLPANSPARTHSNSSTLERKSKFSRAFTLSSSGTQLSQDQKENMRGEQVPVCHDCEGLVREITRSSKQTRSSARNRALQNLTLDLSPVYK